MGDGHSNGATGDTLELLEAEREDIEKALECVRQMARGFDTLTERRKSADAGRVALCLKLRGPDLRRCVWKGFTTPEAFQWYRPAIMRKKALGEQMLQDIAVHCEALVRWAEDLEKREQQYRAGLRASSSVPVVSGENAVESLSAVPFVDPRPDESRSQNNSAGNPGVLIYTNDWDTYIRYTTTQSIYGQLANACITYVESPESPNNVFIATDNPVNVSPSFKDFSYDHRVTITQDESWYYYSAQDAQSKAEERAFIDISGQIPLMVGLSATAEAGGDLVDALGAVADTERTPAATEMVTLYHQGDLENGVSANQSLSTSASRDLSHYDPNGRLYRFDLPRDTLNEWLNTGSAESFIDFHAPSGKTTLEIRIRPPQSGQINQFLVPNPP